jgi:hypothetical protein
MAMPHARQLLPSGISLYQLRLRHTVDNSSRLPVCPCAPGDNTLRDMAQRTFEMATPLFDAMVDFFKADDWPYIQLKTGRCSA